MSRGQSLVTLGQWSQPQRSATSSSAGGRLHPWDDPISTRGMRAGRNLALLSVVTTPCPDRSVHPVGMMRSAGSPVRLGVAGTPSGYLQ
jgi:hypothetical protein